MSVIIRLQNLPWSANALDIRNFFRGLSIPEGGVHIVGGELGDAFIAFSTDEDARQAMMLDGGKLKEIQVKLLLSSRSEMHKVIEAARQNVPILSLTAAIPTAPVIPQPQPVVQPPPVVPVINAFSAALGGNAFPSFGIPGIGNPQEIPQPAVIELPTNDNANSPQNQTYMGDTEKDEDRFDPKRGKIVDKMEKDRRKERGSRSRSRSRERDRKDRKRDRRERSRSRERRDRRRERSRSRERRDRKRRSRSRERSPQRRSRDRRNPERTPNSQDGMNETSSDGFGPQQPGFGNLSNNNAPTQLMQPIPFQSKGPGGSNGPMGPDSSHNRFNDPIVNDTFSKLHELGKKRNPNAFQGDQNGGGGRFQPGRGGAGRGSFRRDGRPSRFGNISPDPQKDSCIVIKNAATHTSYGDVRHYFLPFIIDKFGIKMINDNMGRRTGTIYVRFSEPRSKQIVLQRRPNELKGEKVIIESLDDDQFDAAIDSFMPYREDNDTDEQTANVTEPPAEKLAPFSVLKLTDLPNYVKEHDIIKVFSDFSLLSITLNDCRMSRTKIAYVQFVKPEDAKLAYASKDSYMFGRRHAVINPISNEEYEKQKNTQGNKLTPNDEPIEILDEPAQEVQPPRDPRQRRQPQDAPAPLLPQPLPLGGPFFPAVSSFGQQQGFGPPFPGPQFGGFPAGVGLDPRGPPGNWPNRPFKDDNSVPVNETGGRNDINDEPLDCVLMKGLPSEATDRTIVTFLSDTGAVPARIHLMLDTNGMPSGDCFCEFRSAQEARRAASNHGKSLDGCRVTVDLVTRSVVDEALEGPKQPELRDAGPAGSPRPLYMNTPPMGFGGPRGSFRGRGGYERSFERGGSGGGSFGRGYDRSFRGRGGRGERGGRGFERGGRGRGFSRGRGGFENGRERDEEPDPGLEGFGAPGCVVSMENVPFRSTIDDILQFFSEFELTQDDVIRRYNERGLPTGDARVAFRTPFDAQRAVKTRHMDTILDRRINLSIL